MPWNEIYRNRSSTKSIIWESEKMEKIYLIIGLGNPGREYENTRHNMGFHFLDCFARTHNVTTWQEKFGGLISSFSQQDHKVFLFKPLTYMNNSGEAIIQVIDYYKIPLQQVLILHDDMDLPFGSYRLRKNGSSAGHNGLKSIEHFLKTQNYQRLKFGISKNAFMDVKDYVLGKFNADEQAVISSLEPTIISLLDDFLKIDFDLLMNRYNHKK